MWIWDLPAHVFERLILKVCSLKVHLSVADAEGSFLTSRSSEETECSPEPARGVGWSSGRGGGKETAGEAQDSQREVGLNSANHSLNANMQKRHCFLASEWGKND